MQMMPRAFPLQVLPYFIYHQSGEEVQLLDFIYRFFCLRFIFSWMLTHVLGFAGTSRVSRNYVTSMTLENDCIVPCSSPLAAFLFSTFVIFYFNFYLQVLFYSYKLEIQIPTHQQKTRYIFHKCEIESKSLKNNNFCLVL